MTGPRSVCTTGHATDASSFGAALSFFEALHPNAHADASKSPRKILAIDFLLQGISAMEVPRPLIEKCRAATAVRSNRSGVP
jgi:hypothetical protein